MRQEPHTQTHTDTHTQTHTPSSSALCPFTYGAADRHGGFDVCVVRVRIDVIVLSHDSQQRERELRVQRILRRCCAGGTQGGRGVRSEKGTEETGEEGICRCVCVCACVCVCVCVYVCVCVCVCV